MLYSRDFVYLGGRFLGGLLFPGQMDNPLKFIKLYFVKVVHGADVLHNVIVTWAGQFAHIHKHLDLVRVLIGQGLHFSKASMKGFKGEGGVRDMGNLGTQDLFELKVKYGKPGLSGIYLDILPDFLGHL
jgi:hypothetical protein